MVLPVSLIQDHNLVPPWLQSDLLLRKHLDLVPHHIQPPAKARIDHHASNPHTTKGGPESQKQNKKKMSRRQQPVVRGVELEHGLAVAGPKQLVGQRQNARRLPSPRRTLRERKGEKGDELRCSRPLRG